SNCPSNQQEFFNKIGGKQKFAAAAKAMVES
ncbi:MAG: hypothetical protein ACI92Z_002859, partial [Paracoccaceae bacterium]